MKNKVVFLSYINLAGSTAGAARVRMYSKMLQNEGVEVECYSIHDFYNVSPLIKKLDSNKYIRRLSYIFRLFAYVLSIRKRTKLDSNVVYYLYPTTEVLLDYLLIIYMKVYKKQKIFLEINEIRKWGGAVKGSSFKYYKYSHYEKLSRCFDGLVCISKKIAAYYSKYNNNIALIPILSDANIAYKNNCNYQQKNSFDIGFTGSIDIEKENLDVFFSALSKVSNKGYSITLNLYGVISNEISLYRLINYYNLNSIVKYHGIIEHSLISNVLSMQDLLVLPRAATRQNMYGFSTKLSEYLVSGVPVLVTDVSDNLIYLTPNVDCLLADFNLSDSFADQIESLIDDYDSIAKKIADNAYITARKDFNYMSHSKNFAAILECVSSDKLKNISTSN